MAIDFSEYVVARRTALVRAAVLLGCPQPEAEDIVQTALLRCYRSWRRVVKADQPDAYVYRVWIDDTGAISAANLLLGDP